MVAALRTDLDDLDARARDRLAGFDAAESELLATVRRATDAAVTTAPSTPTTAPESEDPR